MLRIFFILLVTYLFAQQQLTCMHIVKSLFRTPGSQARACARSGPLLEGLAVQGQREAGPKLTSMIEVVVNDRLGKKVRVKCNEDDSIGDLKKLVAAQIGGCLSPHSSPLPAIARFCPPCSQVPSLRKSDCKSGTPFTRTTSHWMTVRCPVLAAAEIEPFTHPLNPSQTKYMTE